MKKLFSFACAAMMSLAMLAAPVTGTSTDNMEGQGNPFTNGYNYSFDAVEGEVTISFTSLENYVGLVAYLWDYTNGFAEKQMTVTDQTATITLHNQPSGAELDFACKFAYAGGMSVTKRFQYTVPTYEQGEGGGTETIYWSNWMGDGAGGGIYNEKYKVQDVNGVSPVNIQKPGWANEPGIYVTFPVAVTNISVAGAAEGAGAVLYLSAFTEEYTTVTVTCADSNTYTFMVYYVDGTKTSTALEQSCIMNRASKVIRDGHVVILRDGKTYTILGQ